MELDPEVKAFVDALDAANLPPFHSGTPSQARALAQALTPDAPGRPMSRVETHAIKEDEQVQAQLYVPADQTPRASILYLHGGGWVLGSAKLSDPFSRELAAATSCAVLSLDYRLAPETPFPGAVEDSYAALQWLSARRRALFGADLPVVVLGDSAGGNLAAVTSNLARERSGPQVAAQVLIYPVTDCDLERGSYTVFKDGPVLTRADMAWFWHHYVAAEDERRNPQASPLRAASLEGAPPSFILTAENDPLRDEGEAYAHALEASGVIVRLKRYAGQVHAFLSLLTSSRGGQEALGDISAFIVQHVGG